MSDKDCCAATTDGPIFETSSEHTLTLTSNSPRALREFRDQVEDYLEKDASVKAFRSGPPQAPGQSRSFQVVFSVPDFITVDELVAEATKAVG